MTRIPTRTKLIPLALSAALPLAYSLPLMAQAPALEEVVVTAQKREERLQDIPIAVSALNSNDLELFRVMDTNSFADQVPNLHIKNGVGSDLTFAIRGLSNNHAANIGFESTVGWYMDGVYFGKGMATLFDLGDIERVEVLRGPQGTLYGRNTIGGAINLVSTRPSGEFGGKLRLSLGNEDLVETSLALDSPSLGEENTGLGVLKGRVSYSSRERDGFTRNVEQNLSVLDDPIGDFDRFGDMDRESLHVAVDWDIRDNLRLSYDYLDGEVDDTPRLFQLIDVRPDARQPEGFADYAVDGFPSIGSNNGDIHYTTEMEAHSLILSWDISDSLTLKSITAYREEKADELIDLDGGATAWYANDSLFDHEQYSQELQLLYSGDSVRVVAGVFYFEEETELLRMQRFLYGGFMRQLNGLSENENIAASGQVDWDINEQWTLAVGARYTDESKNMQRYIRPLPPGYEPFAAAPTSYQDPDYGYTFPELDFDDTSVMLSLTRHLSDDFNVYLKYAEGYRSGGYDGNTASPVAAGTPFDSEDLKSYELGYKAVLLENRLQLNAALFFNDYDDAQVGIFDGSVSLVDNAGEVELYGLELESRALLTDALTVSFNYAYLHYDIKSYDFGPGVGDVSDVAELNNAPENSLSLGLDYRVAQFDWGMLDIFVNYIYSDGVHSISIASDGTAPNSETDDYSLLNARVTLSQIPLGADSSMRVSLWGNNLADEEYYDNIIDWGSVGGFRSGSQGWPRTYGIEATVEF
jgi:iron complex outermembrane receptor protein